MAKEKLAEHEDKKLRDHLLYLLHGGGAHMSLDDFIAEFPGELCNRSVKGVPYTPWQVLEHMRLAQWDIIEFSRNPKHVSPDFPSGYWPKPDQKGDLQLWKQTVQQFREDLKQMESVISNPAANLLAKIPHGEGQTILREALLVADHNSYHLGALAVLSRILKDSAT